MSQSGVLFDRCFTPSYGTARGVWAVITGIPDVESPKTASRNPAIVDQHTIINEFSDYEKFYFIGGSASWANIRGLLKNNIDGLNLYEQDDFEAVKIDVWGISDKNLLLSADKILAKQKQPFFAIIQTADNHPPYTIPDEDLTEFKKITLPEDSLEKNGFKSADEYNAFRYTDFSFQKFIEAAKKKPYFNNTVFVFVGDHGIGGTTDMFPKAWTDQTLTSVHVPLLFYAPGLLQPSRRSNVCSQLDVLPSIAGLVSRPFRNTAMGRNLFDTSLSKDPFRSSSAFVFYPDERKIGIISNDFSLRKFINKDEYEFASIRNNNPLPKEKAYDSVKNMLSIYADAYYETARYLLYNNKRKKLKK
jgi:phosphoglycerol transferase MdoB-like AlkP superfamily enzyme